MKQLSLFLILVGGGFAILCFFMPWLKLEIARLELDSPPLSFSGFSLAKQGNSTTIAFITAWALIGISVYMFKQQTLQKSRIPVLLIISSIGILCVLAVFRFPLLHLPEHTQQFTTIAVGTHLARVHDTTSEMKIESIDLINLQFGGFGASIGFIVAFIGVCYIPKSESFVVDNE